MKGMDCDTMQQWATKEPWNADVSERYYYTMSRMMDQQPDKDDVTILQNKPPPKPKVRSSAVFFFCRVLSLLTIHHMSRRIRCKEI